RGREAAREGGQLAEMWPCEGDDGRGVEAARQEEAEGDVAHERDLHGTRELDPELCRRRREIHVERRRRAPRRGLPVPILPNLFELTDQATARRELLDAGEGARRPGHVAEAEIGAEGSPVRLRPCRSGREDRLRLRGEEEMLAPGGLLDPFLAAPTPG